jgi:polysaccharide biosynthesis transport protein
MKLWLLAYQDDDKHKHIWAQGYLGMKSEIRAVSLDALEIDPQQYWLVLKRRWLPTLSVFISIVLLALFFSSIQKPSYRAQGKLRLKVDRVASLTGVGTELGQFSPLTLQSSPLKTEAEVLTSASLLENVIAQMNLRDSAGKLLSPEAVRSRLEVKPIAGADVLQVGFEDQNPAVTSTFVNQLLNEYISQNVAMSRKQAVVAREVLANQLPKTESLLRNADLALRRYREQNSITNLQEESKILVARRSELETEITRANAELADTSSRLASLQRNVGFSSAEAIEFSSLSQSQGVQQALKDFAEVQSQLAIERSRFEDGYPTVANLKRREDALRTVLNQRINEMLGRSRVISLGNLQLGETRQGLIQKLVDTEVARLGLASRLSLLQNTRQFYEQRALILPKLEQGERELQRQLGAAQATYEMLLKRFQELQLVEQQNNGSADIIESAALPSDPLVRKKVLTLALGFMAALVAALITLIILEMIDRSVKTLKEARQLFKYPWMGSIPHFGKRAFLSNQTLDRPTPELPVRDLPRSPVSAAYRLLQANLKFSNVDKEVKTIAVTSSVPKEGKSTISANLAATIAQLGRRVLLIDADLHRPQQHHIWNLTNAVGLSNVIVRQVEFSDAVNTVMVNLDVLTTGVIPPNPLAFLDSNPMQAIIDFAEKKYDFVILDAPPLIFEAEALTLGKISDGVLMVVRPGVLDYPSAKLAKELLHQSAQDVLGMVINCAVNESEFNRFDYYDNSRFVADNKLPSPETSSLKDKWAVVARRKNG